MIELGFWRGSSVDDERPLPLSDGEMPVPSVLALTLRYLTAHGIIESWEHGYSYCRFAACTASPRTLGCVTLTDGIHVWPEGLVHYILDHRVSPPKLIVEAALKAAEAVLVATGGVICDNVDDWGLPNQLLIGRNHLMWDSSTSTAYRLPKGTKTWLSHVSTLALDTE
jgi:hypothetical protein